MFYFLRSVKIRTRKDIRFRFATKPQEKTTTFQKFEIAVGTTSSISTLVNIPSNFLIGDYYLFLKVDVDNDVTELNEWNNVVMQSIIRINSAVGTDCSPTILMPGRLKLSENAYFNWDDDVNGQFGEPFVIENLKLSDFGSGEYISPNEKINTVNPLSLR